MSHSEIILEIMSAMVPNDHPIIYQYIKGGFRSRDSAIIRLTGFISPIFVGAYDISIIRGEARKFLKQKEKDYKNGVIKIKSIYN